MQKCNPSLVEKQSVCSHELNKLKLPADFICNNCNQLLIDNCYQIKNIHQSECGCRYCLKCLDELILKGECFNCKEKISNTKDRDIGFEKDLKKKQISCDCLWEGTLETLVAKQNDTFNNVQVKNRQKDEQNEIDDRKLQDLLARCQQLINNSLNSYTCLLNKSDNEIKKIIELYGKLKQNAEEKKENYEQLKTDIDSLQNLFNILQTSVTHIEGRFLVKENGFYNGTFMWKISNVKEKINEAERDNQSSICSPPFYTSQTGFKMCASLYLNGEGRGRETHISIYFVLLKGQYDALLTWPFRQKVTFTLIDQIQTDSKENVNDALRPDPNSNSFKRPTSDMNIASGISLFCPLNKFNSNEHEYVKDNTMFIKIIVDTRDLSEI